jgi:hypothetical protein
MNKNNQVWEQRSGTCRPKREKEIAVLVVTGRVESCRSDWSLLAAFSSDLR